MIEAAKLEADIYPAGPRGLSAYEIYKKEGGQLSEEEWLKSLNGLTPTIGENGNWFLGTVDTGLPSRGPKGDTGSIKFIVVTELPTENIDETAIYMKPIESPTGENNFEELIYVNGKWEDLGTPNVAVDLSNYYTKEESNEKLLAKQDKLVAGDGIEISGDNVISSTIDGVTTLTDELVVLGDLAPGYYILNGVKELQYGNSLSNKYMLGNGTPQILITMSRFTTGKSTYGILYSDDDIVIMFNTLSSSYKRYTYSQFATKSELNAKQNKLTAGDNITIENNVISAIIPEIEIVKLQGDLLFQGYIFAQPQERIDIANAIKKVTDDGTKYGFILCYEHTANYIMNVHKSGTSGSNSTFDFYIIAWRNDNRSEFYIANGTIYLTPDFKFYSASRSNVFKTDINQILLKNNTTTYTPTGDYNPATKKYVDDQVGNINTVLATLTTVSEVTK